ncbi:MAG: hypothetical protein AB7N99_06175 [Simkaniaceae bacterium]
MSQVQNNTLHNFVQPALILGSAFLAGRYIAHFPGASQGGLLLTAALGTGTALVSQKWASANEPPFYSFMRVTASLALGAIVAPYAAKALKGRADIAMPAALRFAAVETVLAAVLAVVSSRMTSMHAEHAKYANDLTAWKALEEKERTALAKQFFAADLPPLSLESADLEDQTFADQKAFAQLTPNQLLWHAQMHLHVKDYEPADLFALNSALQAKNLPLTFVEEAPSQDLIDFAKEKDTCITLLHTFFTQHPVLFAKGQDEDFDVHDLFDGKNPIPTLQDYVKALTPDAIRTLSQVELNEIVKGMGGRRPLFKAKDLSMEQILVFNATAHAQGASKIWIENITEECVAIVETNAAVLEWVYAEFSTSLIAFGRIEEGLRDRLNAAFRGAQKGELAPNENPQALTAAEIKELSYRDTAALKGLIDNRLRLSTEQLVALNTRAHEHRIYTTWIWPISQEVVDLVKADPRTLAWCEAEFQRFPVAYAAIPQGLRDQLNPLFQAPIQDAAEILRGLKVGDINRFNQPNAWDWQTYFAAYPDAWKGLSNEIATAFVNAFIRNSIQMLPLDDRELDIARLQLPRADAVPAIEAKHGNKIRWILAIHAKTNFLDDQQPLLTALQKRAGEL